MPTFVGNLLSGFNKFIGNLKLRDFIDKIAPGGAYFKYALGVLAGVGVILFGLLAILFIPGLKNLIFKPVPSPTPVSAILRPPIKPLAKGFQSWDFSYGPAATGPKVKTATVDTLTPPKGGTQTATVTLSNNSPVTNVSAVVYTDNVYNSYQMSLTKGNATNGTWTGTWRINDSFDYVYHINFYFESSTGNSNSTLKFR